MRLLRSFLLAPALILTAAPIDEAKVLDLTHTFDEKTIHWPTAKPFEWRKESWGKSPGGYWYTAASFSASEHLGTHLDSPIHFAEGQPATDQITVQKLIGPVVVIDVARQCQANRDYLLSPADIAAWEKMHGRIPQRSVVLVRTGWSKFWPDTAKYMGTAAKGDTTNLHFPGISPDGAKILVERSVDGVGIDTASLDHGQSKDFRTHRVLNAAGIYGLENLAALDQLPATGSTLIALPMKIRNGTGGPVRVIAVLP